MREVAGYKWKSREWQNRGRRSSVHARTREGSTTLQGVWSANQLTFKCRSPIQHPMCNTHASVESFPPGRREGGGEGKGARQPVW